MKSVLCPHCKAHRILTAKMPKDVVIVIPCPRCHEWIVLFRNKAIALSRKILEHGTLKEKKLHLASVIVEFLEPGLLSFGRRRRGAGLDEGQAETGYDSETPITDQELERFIRVDLNRLDDPAYFKRHLG